MARTAADLMSRSVLLLPKEMSLRTAAHLLSQAHVSGAPVVDDEGRCIGVLSSTDFVHYAEHGKSPHECGCGAGAVRAWQILDGAVPEAETVESIMTKNPVMVPPVTGIGALARAMMDAHIHRVIVVDANSRPVGIVSSTDVLAAVANAEARLELPHSERAVASAVRSPA